MGQGGSKVVRRHATNGIVVTLDALGTLFNFKEPVARQYIKIAKECGLRDRIKESDLKLAFRSTYKDHILNYPNYGKGKLASPEVWWRALVDDTFSKVVDTSSIPKDLGSRLYDHFSSAKAYTLFSDVRPFLDTMKAIRQQYQGASSPSLIIGVITNSDPRVRNILQSFGLQIGDARLSSVFKDGPSVTQGLPAQHVWNPKLDFDFLTTSYDCDAEKPNPGIFIDATKQSRIIELSKSEQGIDLRPGKAGFTDAFKAISIASASLKRVDTMQWIHVGDEVIKDYEGAKNCGLEALLVDRDNAHNEHEARVESLEEVAIVVKLMGEEAFKTKINITSQ